MPAKPYSDEEIAAIEAVHKPGCSIEVIIETGECRACRFLDTIAADRILIKHWQNRFTKKENEIDRLRKRIAELEMKIRGYGEALARDNRRIIELMKQAEIKDSLAESVMTLVEVHEQLEDAKKRIAELEAEIKRAGLNYEIAAALSNKRLKENDALIAENQRLREEMSDCFADQTQGVPITINWEKARALYKNLSARRKTRRNHERR